MTRTGDTGPLCLLDFDGVVNATSVHRPDDGVWPDWTAADCAGFDVWYSPTVVAALGDLHRAGADIRWLSDWLHQTEVFPTAIAGMPRLPWLANPLLASLDVASLDVASLDVAADGRWWKHVVAEEVAGDRPLLWIDDRLDAPDPECGLARRWARGRSRPTVLLAPVATTGLSPADLGRLVSFLGPAAA